MNMKDVIISIVGTQQDASGAKDSVELVTDGQYGFEGDEYRFTYQESELTGLEGTRTTFTVNPMGVVLRREGTLNTEMVFQPGKKNFVLYRTPFGDATMGIDTRSIRSSLSEHGGGLEVDYNLDLNSTNLQRNAFKIEVKENNHV